MRIAPTMYFHNFVFFFSKYTIKYFPNENMTQFPTSDENRPHNVVSQFPVFFSKYTIKYFLNENMTQLPTSDENRRHNDEEYSQDVSKE